VFFYNYKLIILVICQRINKYGTSVTVVTIILYNSFVSLQWEYAAEIRLRLLQFCA
jgi:hypothetical protein